jgi:hypothetical protein
MVDIEVREEGRIIPGSWREDVSTAEGMINVAVIRSNNYEQAASAVRDRYAGKIFFLRRGSTAEENDLFTANN